MKLWASNASAWESELRELPQVQAQTCIHDEL